MALFKLSRHRRYVSDEEYYAWFELAYTTVDVCAAALFVAGYIMVLRHRVSVFCTEADAAHHSRVALRQGQRSGRPRQAI